MATTSENITNNPSEEFNADNRLLSRQLTDQITSASKGISYPASQNPPVAFLPNNGIFNLPGMSNAFASRNAYAGITDFTAYNPHYNVPNPQEVANTKYNVYSTLVLATFRFQMYSRKYR